MKKVSRKFIIPMFFLGLMLIQSSCKKDENKDTTPPDSSTQVPSIATAEVTNISFKSATCGGTITNKGASNVFESGVCWSKLPHPIKQDSSVFSGATGGTFISHVTGLTPGTKYYIRAYAVNSDGIGYGIERTFTTTAAIPNTLSATVEGVLFTPTTVTVDTVNGQIGIAGVFGTESLMLIMPYPPSVGSQSFTPTGPYTGLYSPNGTDLYTSDSGTLDITEYNAGSGKIKGTFDFVATFNGQPINVTGGVFEVYL